MKEFRADGSIPGEDKVGRICLFLRDDGVLAYYSFEGERPEDLDGYENYDGFQRWVTEVLPLDELETEHQRLTELGVPKDEAETAMAAHLKQEFLKAHRLAEKAAHAYFAACPVGEERIKASEIYENIRTALRV